MQITYGQVTAIDSGAAEVRYAVDGSDISTSQALTSYLGAVGDKVLLARTRVGTAWIILGKIDEVQEAP